MTPDEYKAELRRKAEDAFGLSYLDDLWLYKAWSTIQRKVVPVVKTWLINFWNDPASFRAAIRGLVALISGLIVNGVIVFPVGSKWAWYASIFTGAGALMFPAGQTNQSPGVTKAIANDPSIQVTSKDIKVADAAVAASEKSPPGM
jgi:hypothetical protein